MRERVGKRERDVRIRFYRPSLTPDVKFLSNQKTNLWGGVRIVYCVLGMMISLLLLYIFHIKQTHIEN